MIPATSPSAVSAPLGRSQFSASVAANLPLCRDHFRLVLRLPRFPATEPGQFVQIACRPEDAQDVAHEFDWPPTKSDNFIDPDLISPLPMLRRPFSLADRRDVANHVELEVIHRVVGAATKWLAKLSAGDAVDILGPLGNAFSLPPMGGHAVLVGGGVGIPPMLYLATKLRGRHAVAFSGATTADLLPLTLNGEIPNEAKPVAHVAEFAKYDIPAIIATDDGSLGFRGFVTQALEAYLDSIDSKPIIYTCGPELMMKRVADIAARRNLRCQIAVERAMACGMGTCQSCCIRVKKKDPASPPLPGRPWCYRLACTDGPIFTGDELLW